jgi:hypothetical protein
MSCSNLTWCSLADNLLSGTLPDLSGCASFPYLDFSNNRLDLTSSLPNVQRMLDRKMAIIYLPQAFVIGSLGLANGRVVIPWNATPNQYYQVQYMTELNQADWVPIGDPVLASKDTAQISVDPGTDPRRFYRVIGVP